MYTHIHSYAYIHTHVHTHTYIDNKYTHIHTCAHLHTYIPSSLLPHPSSLSSLTHLSLTSLYTVPCLLGDRKIAHSDMYEEVALSGRWTTLLKKLCSSHCFIVFVSLVDHWPLPTIKLQHYLLPFSLFLTGWKWPCHLVVISTQLHKEGRPEEFKHGGRNSTVERGFDR